MPGFTFRIRPHQQSVKLEAFINEPYGRSYCKKASGASDHLVEIPLEVALLHVNLLVGLDHVLQLLLSLLSLLELKRQREAQTEGREKA